MAGPKFDVFLNKLTDIVSPVDFNKLSDDVAALSAEVQNIESVIVSTTSVSSENLLVSDNIITLNTGETGNGVSLGTAGIEIDRGLDDDVTLQWNESQSAWQVTEDGTTFYNLLHEGNFIYKEVRQRTLNTATPSAIVKTDGTLLFDTTSTSITIDLPAASIGKIEIPFKDAGANSAINNITFNRVGADTIVDSATGQTSSVISTNGFSGKFLSNGVDTWYLL